MRRTLSLCYLFRAHPTGCVQKTRRPMKNLLKKIPVIGPIGQGVYRKWLRPSKPFVSSEQYWSGRYDAGGDSGDGSYRKLAEFKAEFLNRFVAENDIRSIIEYGCGDGNQLQLAKYPSYVGFDVSPKAISLCKDTFSADDTKTFALMNDWNGDTAQLTLSLDVIFHLVEDGVFEQYMHRLFDSAESFVIVYSSNFDDKSKRRNPHVRHRRFSEWVQHMKPEWKLHSHTPNKYPFAGDTKTGSHADFFVYERA